MGGAMALRHTPSTAINHNWDFSALFPSLRRARPIRARVRGFFKRSLVGSERARVGLGTTVLRHRGLRTPQSPS
jgi:hypothetical protein